MVPTILVAVDHIILAKSLNGEKGATKVRDRLTGLVEKVPTS